MASVRAAHDDPDWTIDDLALAVRRAVEDQTFEPDSAAAGVHLLDDRAARYGDFDDVAIVGVVETDWPERPRRNIFYPPALLKSLGWPSEKDRRVAADAHFLDLLAGGAAAFPRLAAESNRRAHRGRGAKRLSARSACSAVASLCQRA